MVEPKRLYPMTNERKNDKTQHTTSIEGGAASLPIPHRNGEKNTKQVQKKMKERIDSAKKDPKDTTYK